MDHLKVCSDNHDWVQYSVADCPVCVEKLHLVELVDGREGIDEDNINKLFDIVGKHEEHLRVIEDTVGIELPRKRTFMDVIRRR